MSGTADLPVLLCSYKQVDTAHDENNDKILTVETFSVNFTIQIYFIIGDQKNM